MGRKAEHHIAYRKRRRDYRVAVPDGRGAREFIHGSTREEVLERLNRKLKERSERPNQETRLTAEMPLARYVDRYLNTNRKLGDDAVIEMQKRGLTVVKLDAATLAGWRSEVESAYPRLRGRLIPADLFDEVQRRRDEFRGLSQEPVAQ